MNTETVPTRYAMSLLRLVVERGHDYAGMLDRAGIDFDPLGPAALRPPEIDALQYSRLYQQVVSLLQDQTFGLSLGKGMTPGAFRMMCYSIIHCENLGKAIRRSCEFYRTFYDGDPRLRLDEASGLAVVGYQRNDGAESERPVGAGAFYGLLAWQRFYCWLCGRNVPLTEVRFVGRAPTEESKRERIAELFGCAVTYGHSRNEMVLDAQLLASPLVHTEQSLREFLRTAPYQLMVINESGSSGLVRKVQALIGHDFSQGFPGFDDIARALNMSAPTLRRKLKREGTTFQEIKDKSRGDAAAAYLGNSDLSINAIAALLGFTDPSTFHRSFKKWTGLTPGDFRAREQRQKLAD